MLLLQLITFSYRKSSACWDTQFYAKSADLARTALQVIHALQKYMDLINVVDGAVNDNVTDCLDLHRENTG